tara:strand:- start:357 stop:1046 length:690 start_codon:yes stop_codon:yes gene_type:complete
MTQQNLFVPEGFAVEGIASSDAYPFLLEIHYAKRLPSISYAYGLWIDGELCGVATYGTPAGSTQRTGVCGEEYSGIVLELNRLCLKYNRKNEASRLVSASMKLLPRPSIIISYADPAQGHVGYVYQATNFFYCGMTEKRTDWAIKGLEHLHAQTIADRYRGHDKPSEAIRREHGDNFYMAERPRKHRYIMFLGNKKDKKKLASVLKYEKKPYPKKARTLESEGKLGFST